MKVGSGNPDGLHEGARYATIIALDYIPLV
jgi:hypothetical protein